MSSSAVLELDDAGGEAFERWLQAFAFARSCLRRARLKRLCDCGHWIDGGEPYRYSVWRINLMPRGELEQRSDCEFCARVDLVG